MQTGVVIQHPLNTQALLKNHNPKIHMHRQENGGPHVGMAAMAMAK